MLLLLRRVGARFAELGYLSTGLVALGLQLFAFRDALSALAIELLERLDVQRVPARRQPFPNRIKMITKEIEIVHSCRSSGTLVERDPLLPVGRPRIVGSRADQSIVFVLLENMRRPTRHAADSEYRRE